MLSLPLPTVLRPLAAGTLVSAVGNGAWYASWALFLTRVLELPVAQAGIALTVAGVAGIAAATPLGRLADRVGPREVMIGAQRGPRGSRWAASCSPTRSLGLIVVAVADERRAAGRERGPRRARRRPHRARRSGSTRSPRCACSATPATPSAPRPARW